LRISSCISPSVSNAGEPAADDDEGEQPSLAPGIRCRVGLLETAEEVIPDLERVEDVLHHQRTVGEPGSSAQVDDLSEGDHQLIVGDDRNFAVATGGHVHRLRSHVDLPHFGNANGNARQEQPQRAHRIGGMDVAAGNLREERLKDEEVVAADQFDADVAAGTPAQMLGGEHPAEAPADNDHPVPGLFRQWTRFRRVRQRRRRRDLPHDDSRPGAQCASFSQSSRDVIALPSGHTDPRGGQTGT